MQKLVAVAVLATAMFAIPALPVMAAPLPAKCAVLWLMPDCVDAWAPSARAAAAKPAAMVAAAASPTIRLVRCDKSESPKYLLNCTYE
jgi:hypothetical protein